MCSCENTEKNCNAGIIAALILSALSFVLGVWFGVSLTKKLFGKKKTSKKCSDDFDADEYVRSLNLD